MTDRIVISGRGLVTPIGTGLSANVESLKKKRTGTVLVPDFKEVGLEPQVAGLADRNVECPVLTQKNKRFMSPNSRFAVVAAYEAMLEAGLTLDTIKGPRTAFINGCAGSSYAEVQTNCHAFLTNGGRIRRVTPFAVPRIMPSSAAANVSLLFGIQGESYDISCACTSSAVSIITGARLLASGDYDMVMVGGSEEVSWQQALGFSAMRALSKSYNEVPETASRPFDKSRDGFVLGEGAGIMILEREKDALARGIKPKAVLSGYASNSNAADMVIPDAESSAAVMRKALQNAGLSADAIQYINTHGTATPVGDPVEMNAIKTVFGESKKFAVNSTKSMTGHMIGAAGAVEAIFTSLMIDGSFVCGTANLNNPEDDFAWSDLVADTRENFNIEHALSNSFGFGGSNASLIISKWK